MRQKQGQRLNRNRFVEHDPVYLGMNRASIGAAPKNLNEEDCVVNGGETVVTTICCGGHILVRHDQIRP